MTTLRLLGLRPRRLEEADQIALLNWAEYVQIGQWSLADLLVHVPNGGARSKAEGGRFKAMGVKRGYPDLVLDVPTKSYAGGRWELKHGRNTLEDDQVKRHAMLRACGYYAATFWHWHECAQDMLRYLNGCSFPVIVRVRP